ncbi:ExbD/TolR family protein [Caulifigura coniformis]|uniref:ExbD/TolR family protein n=1 Tax=Caulifigura coniformis TaxID=2527983 RepID=UPI0018D24A53|nr:biopolymer transporter ExbD [Caulifigura coniformis]
MPIQFRCTTCNQLLSISRKKAGVEILCPKCTTLTRVPQLDSTGDVAPPAQAEVTRPETSAPPKAAPLKEVAKSAPVVAPEEQKAPRREAIETPPVPAPPVLPPPVVEAIPRAPEPAPEESAWENAGQEDEFEEFRPPEVEDDAAAFLHAAHGGLSSPVPPLAYNPWVDIDHDEDEFHPTQRQHPPKDELDMTSLVDVTFLLLVFFMITASFTVQKFLQIASPESDDNAAAATAVVSNDDIVGESVVVAVDAEDRIVVDDKPVGGLAELKDLFIQKRRDEGKSDVLIEAVYQATHGTVVAVTDMAMQAEMRHVRRASRRDADN